MLSFDQKADILRKSGVTIPAFPARRLPVPEFPPLRGGCLPQVEHGDAEQEAAVQGWHRQIEALYVEFVAARSARSARDSDQTRMLDALRKANVSSSASRREASDDATADHDE